MPWSLVNQPICDAIVILLNSFHEICEQVIDSLAALVLSMVAHCSIGTLFTPLLFVTAGLFWKQFV